MRISAKEDYAIRAAVELAAANGETIKREEIARAQDIPSPFLENILLQLKRAELVDARRGAEGGFRLALPAAEISVADVIRAVSGPLVTVRGMRPQTVEYSGAADSMTELWIALRANLRWVLETVTLADLANGKLPARIRKLAEAQEAWD